MKIIRRNPVAMFLAVMSAVCVITAVRIERLDYLANGAIRRKAEQEPHSKWRTGGEMYAAYRQAEREWRKEKGIAPHADLSRDDREAIKVRARSVPQPQSPGDRLGEVLYTWGLLQYPLAAGLVVLSLVAAARQSLAENTPKWVFGFQALVGACALGLAIYRGYFTSLGF